MRPHPTLIVGVAAVGFGLVIAINAVSDAQRSSRPRRDQLLNLIADRRSDVDELEDEFSSLRSRVRDVEGQITSRATEAARARQQIRALAGLTAVEGEGVRVVMRDSALQARDPLEARALRILDVDLQLVTNALWASGAEAIAVNGRRIVAFSSIRGAGNTITVNFRPLSSPYEVVAAGADIDRFRRSEVAQRFERWVDLFGFGFEVDTGDVTVPAYTGSTRLTTARTADDFGGG